MLKAIRPGHRQMARLLTVYLVLLAFVVLWPTPVDRDAGKFLELALAKLHERGVPEWFNYSLVEWLSNVAMFVPFGVLVAFLLGRGAWWKATLCGFALSASVEGIQYLFFAQRTASVLDLLANTLGALIGAAVLLFLRRIGKNTLV